MLKNLASATTLAASRTSQEAVVFASLDNTETPEVYHLDDEDEEEGERVLYVDDMTEAEFLMTVVDPDFRATLVNHDTY